MRGFKQSFDRFITDETAQDLIEYALVAALVGLGAVTAMRNLATHIGNAFGTVGNTLDSDV